MDNYSDLNNAFNNKGVLSTDLEEQARQINEQKNRDTYPNPCHQPSNLNMTHFYSAHGDYNEVYKPEQKGTLIKQLKQIDKNDDISLSLDNSSIGTKIGCIDDSSFDSSDKSSNNSLDTHEIDKHIKTKSKFKANKKSKRHKCIDFDLMSIDSIESLESGESLLHHIRFCNECKMKVLSLIKNKKNDKFNENQLSLYNVSNTSPIEINVEKQTDFFSFNVPELKEILIVCLIGFLIIIILDLIMRIEKN